MVVGFIAVLLTEKRMSLMSSCRSRVLVRVNSTLTFLGIKKETVIVNPISVDTVTNNVLYSSCIFMTKIELLVIYIS